MAEKLDLETLEAWLWDSANIMRGHTDSSDFKNYIFGLLFLKRVNDQFFEEAKIATKQENIGQAIDQAFSAIEEANPALEGVITTVHLEIVKNCRMYSLHDF